MILAEKRVRIFEYKAQEKRWEEFLAPENITKIYFGSDPERCHILIEGEVVESIHTVVLPVDGYVMIIERSQEASMSINGVVHRQTRLFPGESCIVKIEEKLFLIHALSLEGASRSTVRRDEKQYVISWQGRGQVESIAFNIENNCLIGNFELSDIKISGEPISALIASLHKQVYVYSPLPHLCDVKIDGTSVNDVTFARRDFVLEVGEYLFNIILPDIGSITHKFSLTSKIAKMRLCFIKISGERTLGEKYILPETGRTIFIGRANDNYFTLASQNVSRRHARIIIRSGSLLVSDCDTRNGTYVNGKRITTKDVYPGDFLKFGDTTFLLCYTF